MTGDSRSTDSVPRSIHYMIRLRTRKTRKTIGSIVLLLVGIAIMEKRTKIIKNEWKTKSLGWNLLMIN